MELEVLVTAAYMPVDLGIEGSNLLSFWHELALVSVNYVELEALMREVLKLHQRWKYLSAQHKKQAECVRPICG